MQFAQWSYQSCANEWQEYKRTMWGQGVWNNERIILKLLANTKNVHTGNLQSSFSEASSLCLRKATFFKNKQRKITILDIFQIFSCKMLLFQLFWSVVRLSNWYRTSFGVKFQYPMVSSIIRKYFLTLSGETKPYTLYNTTK